MTPGPDPAVGVLLAACDPAADERLERALGRVRDWDGLCRAAERHNMTGVLHRRLQVAGPGAVPARSRERLGATAGETARKSLRMTAQLVRLLRVLDAAGVRAVPFKGAVLSQQAYGDPGARHFGDLDLLMSTEDVLRARAVLAGAGFHGYLAPYDGPADAVLLRVGLEVVLRRGDGLMVELHDQACTLQGGASALRAAHIVERAGTVEIYGARLPAVCEDDVVLVQCVHGSRHGWDGLEHVACLVGPSRSVTRRGAWPVLLGRAAEAGALRKLLAGVLLVHVVVDDDPPEEVLAAAAGEPAVWDLVADALGALLQAGGERPRTRQGDARWLARYEDSRLAAARLLWRRWTLPGPEDWAALKLPPRAFPLYWAWRPVRLGGKHARRAARRWRSGPPEPRRSPGTPRTPRPTGRG